MSHLTTHRVAPRSSPATIPYNVYGKDTAEEVISTSPNGKFRNRHNSGSVQRPPSIFNGIRDLIRPRSESLGAQQMRTLKKPKKVTVAGCHLDSVYDLREGDDDVKDFYDDECAFRRPRSNSSDFLILRKTSRPLSVDVVGLVDKQSDPYRQYMNVVDCYELAPTAGNLVAVDKKITVERAFQALCENNATAALVWDSIDHRVDAVITITDFLAYIHRDDATSSQGLVTDLVSGIKLISVSATDKLYNACVYFCRYNVHRVLVNDADSGDPFYLLTVKRVLQAIHKQNRSLHFAQWLSCPVKKSAIGNWMEVYTVPAAAKVHEAIGILLEHRASSLPAVDGNGRAIGVIHKSTIAEAMKNEDDPKAWSRRATVQELLPQHNGLELLSVNDSIGKVLDALLAADHTRSVYLLDENGKAVSSVSQLDVIRHLLEKE